jgi:hypothetical protein
VGLYGLLIASRPVITWNVIAVLINFTCVGAHGYFVHKEKRMTCLSDDDSHVVSP